MTYPHPPAAVEVATIANGQTDSNAIDTAHYKVGALQFGTMTGTTMKFLASAEKDGPFVLLKDDATPTPADIEIGVVDDAVVALTSTAASMALAAVRFVKLRSGAAEGAERQISFILNQ